MLGQTSALNILSPAKPTLGIRAFFVEGITGAASLNDLGTGMLFAVSVGMLVGLEYRKNSETQT